MKILLTLFRKKIISTLLMHISFVKVRYHLHMIEKFIDFLLFLT